MFITETGNNIDKAKEFLEAGEIVAIPTETVYGLAGNALNADTVLKIFAAKNRPFFDPLIVHTHSKDEIQKYVEEIPAPALALIDRFMPGPVTVLLKKKKIIPDLVTSGLDTVAIRIPNHPMTLSLLKELSFPLAAPSANPFGYISPTTAAHVSEQLQGKIPYILDGGATTVGVESTIIGFDEERPLIYRLGGLTIEEIEKVIGKVNTLMGASISPLSPGMLKSHYAPRKKLTVIEPDDRETEIILQQRTGVLAFDKYLEGIPKENQILLSPSADLNEAAKNLFSAMRSLDMADIDVIWAVKFPDTGLGRAINDRLKRASGK